MNFKRKSYKFLLEWKSSPKRKPLIIRGARQVGKTTLAQMFGREFPNFIYLNLEKSAERDIFDKADDIKEVLNSIFLLKNIVPTKGEILLFIDEIQESPKAIQQLRYFYEELPEIYVIAAGSLLEFALSKVPSFPVGRVEYLCLHPLDFEEYLSAIGQTSALEELQKIPIEKYAHETLLKNFHDYAMIGGMPEVVRDYAEQRNVARLKKIYNQIWQSYKDDVEKYARNEAERKVIRHIIETAPLETDRIKFENFGKSHYRSREVGEAIRTLEMARVIQLIYPTTSLTPPMMTDLRKRPRLQLLDTGLLNHALGLQQEMIGIRDLNDFHRGKIIQHLVTQQLIAIHNQPLWKPHFWVRESKSSTAEIDLVFHHRSYVFPIEIKAGEKGTLRSMHQFIESSNHPYGIRISANNFLVEEAKTPSGTEYLLLNLPYYASTKIPEYIEWYIENYKPGK